MRTFDFSPLYRATVGFDRVADLMDRVLSADVAQPTYPPYNIEKTAEDAYRISIAVAGFTPEELSVEVKDGHLYVAARKEAGLTAVLFLVVLTVLLYLTNKQLWMPVKKKAKQA